MVMNVEFTASSGHSESRGGRGSEVHVQQVVTAKSQTAWQDVRAES